MLRNILLAIIILVLSCPAALAEGLSGWATLSYGSEERTEDGTVVQSSDFFRRNAFLQLEEPFTPMISYRLDLRAIFTDTDVKDQNGVTTTKYQRLIAPGGEIFLRNPVYSGNAGFRHEENWQTARLQGDNVTRDNYYGRFGVTPYQLPSLFFDYDLKKDRNEIPGQEKETSKERYSGISSYRLDYGRLNTDYSVNYTRNIDETPLNVIQRTELDQLTAQYGIKYGGTALRNVAGYQTFYKANYLQQDRTIFLNPSSVSQQVVLQRTALDGLVAQGTFVQQEVTPLNSLGALIDGNVNAGIPSINIGTQLYYNTGIQVIQGGQTVDRLYLYVNRDVSSDVNLRNPGNWRIFVSDSNLASTVWTSISINRVDITVVDVANEIYRYELIFDAPQNAAFYKAINLATVNVLGVSDVLVTEIEAWGTEVLPPDRVSSERTAFYRQEIAFTGNLRFNRVAVNGRISLLQDDVNPGSLTRSMANILENIFHKSFNDGGEDSTSTINRHYSVSSSWIAHRYLTTEIRYSRREKYDSTGETDDWENIYELLFRSSPVPTLNTNLALTQRDAFSLGDRSLTERSAIATVGAELFRDVDLVTDLGYRRTEAVETDTTSKNYFVLGTLNAILTPRLSTIFSYDFNWITSDGNSFRGNSQSLFFTYQPGKYIIATGNIRRAESEGRRLLAETLFLDWLPLRTIRLTLNYQHSDSVPDNVQRDSAVGSLTWYITRFFDFRVVWGYSRDKAEIIREQTNLLLTLSLRL